MLRLDLFSVSFDDCTTTSFHFSEAHELILSFEFMLRRAVLVSITRVMDSS